MSKWIVVQRPRPNARLRLFCIPHAGRGASLFHAWASRLPETIELCAIQLPGREIRRSEPPLRDLRAIVDGLVPEILPRLDRPYALFGHSMGALIAFELAYALRRAAVRQPTALILSGRRGPTIPGDDPILHQLSDTQFVATICERYNGIPQVVMDEPELLKMLLPTLRADICAIETYVFGDEPPLAMPFLIYGGMDDPQMTPQAIDAWRRLTAGGMTLRLFPGGHFYLQDDRDPLIDRLTDDLSRLMPQSRASDSE